MRDPMMPARIARVSQAAPWASAENTASPQGALWRRSGGRPESFALLKAGSAGNVAAKEASGDVRTPPAVTDGAAEWPFQATCLLRRDGLAGRVLDRRVPR